MNITRREALKQCLVITIGAALIPACVSNESKPVAKLNNIKLKADEQQLISDVAETIIPATDTPGAKDTYTHLFVLRMLDDCTAKQDQENFLTGLKGFEALTENRYNKSFAKISKAQKDELITTIISKKDVEEGVVAFYETMKKLTVQGYMTSQYYLTNVRVYKLVPGKFSGCIPVTSLNQKEGSI